MPISICKYIDVEKDGETFHSLRAAGLAVELAHKLARDIGFGQISHANLLKIQLSGPRLKIREAQRWRKIASGMSITLKIAPADAKLAFNIFKKQREFLADMGLNVWQVDPRIAIADVKSPDLIADAGPTSCLSLTGFAATELKLYSATRLEYKIDEAKSDLIKNFTKLQTVVDHIAAGILLVSSVEQNGRTWQPLPTRAFLWQDNGWQHWGGPGSRGPHRHRMANKKPLVEVWDQMTWYDNPSGGEEIGMVAHFLEALGLNKNNASERVSAWKAAFPQRGPAKLALSHVAVHRGGGKCWVGTQAAFRQVYNLL